MVISKVRLLRFAKEGREGRKLTYETMEKETGLGSATIARLLKDDPLERIEGKTLSVLCKYFAVGIADILEYVPDEEGEAQ